MECKNCATENPEGAVYCKNCGKRLDGKKNCSVCGAVIDEDSVYCNACGAKADGKVVSRNVVAPSGDRPVKVKKILNFISLGCVMAVAVLSIIFVCLTGLTMQSDALGGVSDKIGIFDYFSKEIQEVNDFFKMNTDYSAAYRDSLYLPAVWGLISVIISLVGTIACAVTGLVKSILSIVRKNGKSATVWALLAFVFYLFGACMMMSINAASISSPMPGADTKVVYNGATVAGIVLCTIAVACLVGCDTTTYFLNGKITVSKIVGRALAVAVTVGAVIAVAMLVSPVAKLDLTSPISTSSGSGKVTVTTGMGLLGMFAAFITANGFQSGEYYKSDGQEMAAMETYAIIGQAFIFIAVIAALMLFFSVISEDGKKSRILSVVSSGVLVAAVVVALIMTVLAGNKFCVVTFDSRYDSAAMQDVTYEMKYPEIIVAVVFAVIAFAANICRVVYGDRNKADN